ncbi:hypothetical protein WJ60_06285 [Burkholderia ubonensis]|nr:hypothetical protein WJ60_06285 [Burkholderia ubonensis]
MACSTFAVLAVFQNAHADYIDDAAWHYQLDPDLLRSIAYFESHLNPSAFHRNENGTVDIGLMQINSVHLPELRKQGIDAKDLTKPQINADVGAAMLREHIDQYGGTWQSMGEYHSHSPALRDQYARAIHDIYVKRPWAKAGVVKQQSVAKAEGAGVAIYTISAD